MRLDKFMVEASVGTRKVVRDYIKDGLVSVNQVEVLEPAAEIDEDNDVIRYLGSEVTRTRKLYYMLNKPGGCITARKDANCKTVLDYFNINNCNGLFPVGRLDKDTEGLLLLTNDGEFNHRIMYPDKHVEKTYFFWAFGSLDILSGERLLTGLSIGEEEALAKATKLEIIENGFYQDMKDKMDIENIKDIKKNPNSQCVVSGYLTITEGRKHQVKRMLKAVGCYVVYLKRVSIGELMLDPSLELGQYRELTQQEIRLF